MAYVMGYFYADGSMFINPRGSRYIAFYSTDYELLSKVKKLLGSSHKISIRQRRHKRWKPLHALQIGSKQIFSAFSKLGVTPSKAKRLSLPEIPQPYFRHFVRGYFDGDGCISYGFYRRKDRKNRKTFYCHTRFASGTKTFLKSLSQNLALVLKMGSGSIIRNTAGFHLLYSKNNSLRLFNFMYNKVSPALFLIRKHRKFNAAYRLSGAVA
jgi:intein-encoded DNA endonuclease-like protein